MEEELWANSNPVQYSEELHQADDVPTQQSEEKWQYPFNPGSPAAIKKAIGPSGGIIELVGYKVLYRSNSLKEEKEIELSIDNDPRNFPREGLPITCILNIKPSMKLEIPAIVTMPTTCRAASGEASIQIWSKEEGQDWQKSQTVSLTNKNEITFETDHFSKIVGTSVDGNEDNLEYTIKNRLFIQKDTGAIFSVFWWDDKSIQETFARCTQLDLKEVHPMDLFFTGRVNAQFEVVAKCVLPCNIKYLSSDEDDPAIFPITSTFIKFRRPWSIEFLPDEIPDSIKQLRIKYSVSTQKSKIFLVKWPIEIKDANASTIIAVDNSQTLADTIAETGARVQKNSVGTKTQLTM